MARISTMTAVAACALTLVSACRHRVQPAPAVTGRIDVTVLLMSKTAPGVTVDVTGPTNHTMVTDAQGAAHFLDLAAGTYQVRVALPGFSEFRRTNLPVAAGSSVPVVVNLHPLTAAARPPRQTGHQIWASGTAEPPGFGLYSYLLFGSPPSEARRPTYLAAIEGVLAQTPEVSALIVSRERKDLNILLLPVVTSLPSAASAAEVLQNYDYGRAAALLAILSPEPRLDGPYLVSTLQPLGGSTEGPRQYLYQDLSAVPPAVMPAYIHEFKRQAARTDYWRAASMMQWVLGFRSALDLLGQSVPNLKAALLAVAVEWKTQ